MSSDALGGQSGRPRGDTARAALARLAAAPAFGALALSAAHRAEHARPSALDSCWSALVPALVVRCLSPAQTSWTARATQVCDMLHGLARSWLPKTRITRSLVSRALGAALGASAQEEGRSSSGSRRGRGGEHRLDAFSAAPQRYRYLALQVFHISRARSENVAERQVVDVGRVVLLHRRARPSLLHALGGEAVAAAVLAARHLLVEEHRGDVDAV